MFFVGQKVVCINDGWINVQNLVLPKKDVVYSIRGVMFSLSLGAEGLYLCEIVNPPCLNSEGFSEIAWNVEGFRPLVERETSIEVFQEIRRDVERRQLQRKDIELPVEIC